MRVTPPWPVAAVYETEGNQGFPRRGTSATLGNKGTPRPPETKQRETQGFPP